MFKTRTFSPTMPREQSVAIRRVACRHVRCQIPACARSRAPRLIPKGDVGLRNADRPGRRHFLVDDPQKPVDARSETQRKEFNQWVSNTLMSRLDSKEKAAKDGAQNDV